MVCGFVRARLCLSVCLSLISSHLLSLSLYPSYLPRAAARRWRAGRRCRWCTPRLSRAPHGTTPCSMSNTVTAWDAYCCSLTWVRGLTGPNTGTSRGASQPRRAQREAAARPWTLADVADAAAFDPQAVPAEHTALLYVRRGAALVPADGDAATRVQAGSTGRRPRRAVRNLCMDSTCAARQICICICICAGGKQRALRAQRRHGGAAQRRRRPAVRRAAAERRAAARAGRARGSDRDEHARRAAAGLPGAAGWHIPGRVA